MVQDRRNSTGIRRSFFHVGNDKVRFDFQLCRPTEYAYSAFDNVNDARMWKTFKTVFVLNSTAQTDKNKIVADNGLKDVSQPASTSFAQK